MLAKVTQNPKRQTYSLASLPNPPNVLIFITTHGEWAAGAGAAGAGAAAGAGVLVGAAAGVAAGAETPYLPLLKDNSL